MSDVVEDLGLNEKEVQIDTAEKGNQEEIISEVKVKRTRKKKVKVDFKLNRNDYYVTEKYQEVLKLPRMNRRGQVVTEKVPTGRELEREVLTDHFIKEYGRGNRDNKYAMHRANCCFRTCEAFDVKPEHIEKAYIELSGKKIDGIVVNDLIDRFGWSDGEQRSRAMIAKKYDKQSINVIDIAQQKLYDIINTDNPTKAYVELVQEIKEEFGRNLRDTTVYGE